MPHFLLNHSQTGPLIDLYVALSTPRLQLLQAGNPQAVLPQPKLVKALVDTGASHTSIDLSLVQDLNLIPSGVASLITPTTGNVPCDALCYDVAVHIPFPTGILWTQGLWVVTGLELHHQGFDVLLGRDILANGMLIYDGVHQQFTLSL